MKAKTAKALGATLVLTMVGWVFVYPLIWMVLASFKTNQEIFRPLQFWPSEFAPKAWTDLFAGETIPFARSFWNSLAIAFGQAVGAVAVTAMAGFALARHNLRWRHALMLAAVLVILIPQQVMALPLTSWLIKLKLNDNLLGVILPGMASGLGLLFFREIFRKVPREYLEQARLEGASEFRVFRTLLPLVSSALLTYGLIHFILAWHEHLIPLMVLDDANKQTLPLVLARINDPITRTPKALVMAASCMTLVPTAVLFGVLYRQFRNAMADVLMH